MKKYILLTTESNKNLVPKFFDNTATTYDKVAHWATLGKDTFWKNEILKQIPEVNSILDLACGTGILTRKIAKKFPNTKIVGVDITETYLNLAKKNSASYNNIQCDFIILSMCVSLSVCLCLYVLCSLRDTHTERHTQRQAD